MVVAVAVVDVVQVIADEVIDVIAVRYGIVATSLPVHVTGLVLAARMPRLALRRVGSINGDHALVDVVSVRVMKMPVVQVVDVTVVANGAMTAVGAMDVVVPLVNRVGAHRGNLPMSNSTANERARTLPTSQSR